MVRESVYAPHYGFYINKIYREGRHEMDAFHFHKKYEVYYLTSGRRTYFIGDSSYLIEPGSLVLVDKDEPHKTGSPDEQPHCRFVINFSDNYIESIASQLEDVDLFRVFQSKIKVLMLNHAQQLQVEKHLNRMLESAGEGTAEAIATTRLQLCELLLMASQFMKMQTKVSPQPKEITNPTVNAIIQHITTHYNQKLSLQAIAEHFALSPNYLSRMFKKATNASIIDYINSVRMYEAKKLLEETSDHISAIALQVGFNTTTHFTRTFKNVTGLSPQSYRRIYHI